LITTRRSNGSAINKQGVSTLLEFLSECPEGIPLSEICRQKTFQGAGSPNSDCHEERGLWNQDASDLNIIALP
jgi:hypothetical protein